MVDGEDATRRRWARLSTQRQVLASETRGEVADAGSSARKVSRTLDTVGGDRYPTEGDREPMWPGTGGRPGRCRLDECCALQ